MMPEFEKAAGAEFIAKFNGPMDRQAQPEEQAWPLAFLNSDAASFVTGCNVVIDGGFLAGVMTGAIDVAELGWRRARQRSQLARGDRSSSSPQLHGKLRSARAVSPVERLHPVEHGRLLGVDDADVPLDGHERAAGLGLRPHDSVAGVDIRPGWDGGEEAQRFGAVVDGIGVARDLERRPCRQLREEREREEAVGDRTAEGALTAVWPARRRRVSIGGRRSARRRRRSSAGSPRSAD